MRIPMLHRILGWMARRGVPGHGRLAKWITGRFLILARTRYDTILWLDPRERVDREILRTGSFDDEVIQGILERLQSGDVMWDIGANIGHHAVAIQKTRADVRVVAFEPLPKNVQRLKENKEQNQLQIVLHSWALGEKEGEFNLFTTPANAGRTSLHEIAKSSEVASKVKVQRAESLLNSGEPFPNILKIDVEGAEIEVLRGFGEHLRDPRLRSVIFEVVEVASSPARLLEEYGFEVSELDERGNYLAERPT